MSINYRLAGRPPTTASRSRRFATLALAAATAAATLPALLFAAPASAASGAGTPPYWADSAFNVPSGVGASVPFTEYQAVNASTTGTLLSPSYVQGSLASEAVGREAIQLNSSGQYVKFTMTSATNAIDLHYAVPQGESGTLSVYVNGTELSQQLNLTSAYSYISTGSITGSMTHDMYDDARMLLGQTVAAGGTITVEVTSSTSDLPVTVNVLDGYDVAAAATQPANSISVVTDGADPTGANNSQNAFNEAISAANAAGETVWVPAGTYLISSPLQMTSGTIAGAGNWYTQLDTNMLIDNTSNVAGPINLSNFMIQGNQVGRNDGSVANGIDGSLGTGSVVNGLWIQNTNVGFWLQYGNTNCTVENSIVQDTDADGLNFNGNATGCTVKNNYFRNTGDDSIAIWSYPATDSNITLENNTIDVSTLANGIAEYGGTNNTIENNVVADTNALGSGLDISNEQFLSGGFTPLAGTITVTGNYLIRDGQYNPNWAHPMGALQIDPYDFSFSNVTINISGGAILDSPYEAIELVSGDGEGNTISGVNISNINVQNAGTTVFQAETAGSASVSGVTASGIGVAGTYNDEYDSGTYTPGAFTFNLGTGNSGWSTTPVLTAFPNPAQPGSLTDSTSVLNFGDVNSGSTSAAQTVTVTNPGPSAAAISSLSATGPFSQTNTCGSSLAANASCTISVKFAPTSGGALTGSVTLASNAPGSPLTIALSGTGVTSTTDIAQGATVTASSTDSGFPASNAVDGNTSSYWESNDGSAYPQTITVQLPQSFSLGSVTLDLPPSSAWATRTETLSVLGSTNGTSFTTLVGSATYTFDPSTGNTVSFNLPSGTTDQYVELSFTANSGWTAAQLSEFEIFPGSGGGTGPGSATLTASPTSLAFGNETVGSTTSAQSVTIQNTGTAAASISSVSAGSPFAETNNCGSSLAAGASCTANVTFTPSATGSASGSLTVNSNATNGTLTVGLSGTGTAATSATLTATPTSVAFGSETVGSTTGAQSVTIKNTGTATATLSSVSAPAPFAESNTCGSSIAAGASCTASVTFTPTTTGAASGSLTVNSNATNGTLTVALTGTGTAAASATLTATPTSVAFGSETVGSTTAAQTVTIKNTGTASASISSVSAGAPFAETNTCGSSLAAGASCTASVTFTPSANGAASGNLTVNSNASNGTLTVALSGTGTGGTSTPVNLALNAPITASSYTQTYVASNANDGNTSTYWEGTNGAWPTTLAVNLGASDSLTSVVVDLPPSSSWGTRTQTFSVMGSTNGSTYSTLVASGVYTFNPSTGNTVSINLPSGTTDQYVELSFTANSVQNGAQASEFQVWGTSSGASNPNLALNKSVTASSYTQTYVASNAVDGNTSTYWEGTNGAWPTTLSVDLGSSQTLGSVTLDLPPSSAWGTRTQTLSILGSTNGSTYTTLVGSATYTFNPSTGNTVSINLPSGTSDRYVELSFTANSVQNGAQLSEFEIFG